MSAAYEELFEAFCQESLDADGRSQLTSLLRDNAQQRRSFADYLLFRATLIEAGLQLRDYESTQRGRSRSRPIRRRRARARRTNWAFRIAAGLLLVVGLFSLGLIDRGVAPVGRASGDGVRIVRDGGEVSLRPSSELRVGDRFRVDAGSALQLHFADGTSLTLRDGEAELLNWRESKQLRLLRGSLHGEVTPQGDHPLRISSSEASATVRGTVFTMRVGEGWSELSVSEGLVDFTRASDGDTLAVPAGRLARVSAIDPWSLQDDDDEIRLQLSAAEILPGSPWRYEDATLAVDGDADPSARLRGMDDEHFPVRFRFFAEAGIDYRLWIRARCTKVDGDLVVHDMVLPAITGAEWDLRGYSNPSVWHALPAHRPAPQPLINGWGTHFGKDTAGWLAGGEDPIEHVGRSQHPFTFRLARSGVHELDLYAVEGPLRIEAIRITSSDSPPE